MAGTNTVYEEDLTPEEWLDLTPEEWLDLARNLADEVNETEV